MTTTVAVVDLEKVVRESSRNARYTQEWEQGDEMKSLQDWLEKHRKNLDDYRKSIGDTPLTTKKKADETVLNPYSGLGHNPFGSLALPVNTEAGNRVAELERRLSGHESYIRDCRNGRTAINTSRIRNEVRQLLSDYAKSQGIDLVLFYSDTVFYMTDAVDITPEVLALYDSEGANQYSPA